MRWTEGTKRASTRNDTPPSPKDFCLGRFIWLVETCPQHSGITAVLTPDFYLHVDGGLYVKQSSLDVVAAVSAAAVVTIADGAAADCSAGFPWGGWHRQPMLGVQNGRQPAGDPCADRWHAAGLPGLGHALA